MHSRQVIDKNTSDKLFYKPNHISSGFESTNKEPDKGNQSNFHSIVYRLPSLNNSLSIKDTSFPHSTKAFEPIDLKKLEDTCLEQVKYAITVYEENLRHCVFPNAPISIIEFVDIARDKFLLAKEDAMLLGKYVFEKDLRKTKSYYEHTHLKLKQ